MSLRSWFNNVLRRTVPIRTTGLVFQLRPGMQFQNGELELIQEIASHGMGTIWKARNRRRGFDVALKFPQSNNATSVANLALESQFCLRLNHPNIIKVFGLGRINEDILYIEEELIKGPDLGVWLDSRRLGFVPWHDFKKHAFEILSGLTYAHNRSICHRDVKPRNIMLSEMKGGYIAKIIDFGISAATHETDQNPALVTGARSIHYCSPEQLRGVPAQLEDDVYGFCATLYHLLTGRVIFDGYNIEDAIREARVPDPNNVLKELGTTVQIPAHVVRAMLLGLHKDSLRRPDICQLTRMLQDDEPHTVPLSDADRWNTAKPIGRKMRLAKSGVMVIECLTASLGLNEFCCEKDMEINKAPMRWDETVIQKLANGSMDGAVVNKWAFENFKAAHPHARVSTVCECARSMGGDCFCLIGNESVYPKKVAFQDLASVLIDNTLFVNNLPEHLKAVDLFLNEAVGKKRRARVTVPHDFDPRFAFQMLQICPRALIYCGQNFRLVARQRQDFVEAFQQIDCPPELQNHLVNLTNNLFVVSDDFANFVGRDDLERHCAESQVRFRRRCQQPEQRAELVEKIALEFNDYRPNSREIREAFATILIRTFR